MSWSGNPTRGTTYQCRPASPGPAAGRRGDDVQPALRVQHVGQAEQVMLVGPAAVVEDEQALGRAAAGRSL